ncbi:MAG: hypothetical protein OQK50_05045 [Deltaproteobacteria bacterium]|jgi:putative sterol carrier protein|nr:hypothetical protein [Deltaproteobacteria bacterium]MCW8894097.1 hypothetical protein [Deltaproteobacteria bacterium]MCW9049682.1 hypothetical protein [Deltaproteobacteria bacterium]
MLEEIFSEIPQIYDSALVDVEASIYFSIGEVKQTVQLSSEGCQVNPGKTVENADCVCKTSPEFFLKVWNEGYKPGMKDFLSGDIKSNNPSVLQTFLKACGKAG